MVALTNYIEFGFIETNEGKPMCVNCLQVLVNEAMKPAKLRRHFLTKDPEYINKTKKILSKKRWSANEISKSGNYIREGTESFIFGSPVYS